jgi:ABC-2 type transport system ATP-binding protein
MIEISELTRRFGAAGIRDVSFTCRPGTVTGFLGPNGAGKTTTMRLLCGLDRPDAGRATIDGQPYARLPQPGRRVGVMLDAGAMHRGRTGRETLALAAAVLGADRTRVSGVLDLVGLDHGAAAKRVGQYSLGMRQRLALGIALLGDPGVLILDEPANGLDPQGVREMRGLIGRLAGTGRTVLVSSHDLSELEQVCDWLVLIDTGRSLYQGPTSDLLKGGATGLIVVPQRSADHPALRDLLVNRGHEVELSDDRLTVSVNGADVSDLAASVNRAAFDAGMVLVELSPNRTTLEDRYLSMVHGGAR